MKQDLKPIRLHDSGTIFGYEKMSDEEIFKAFEAMCLPRTETKVYLDLVKNGDSTATAIAKRTKLHRSNVYDTLTKLKEKNLVYSIIREGRKVFIALSSDMLVQQQREKMDAIKTAAAYLEKLYSPGESAKIYLLEGMSSFRNLLFSLLEFKKPILLYGVVEKKESQHVLNTSMMQSFHAERMSKGISLKCLLYEDSAADAKALNKMKYTEARLLPKLPSKGHFFSHIICDKKIYLVIWIHPLQTVVIENETISKEFSDMYSLLWNASKKS